MATKDITDLQVLRAYAAAKAHNLAAPCGARPRWPTQILMAETGQCEKVCIRAMERCDRRGYIEWGVSLRAGWLTEKGERLLASHKSADACTPKRNPLPPIGDLEELCVSFAGRRWGFTLRESGQEYMVLRSRDGIIAWCGVNAPQLWSLGTQECRQWCAMELRVLRRAICVQRTRGRPRWWMVQGVK